MKCIYCGLKSGFLNPYHDSCQKTVDDTLNSIITSFKEYNTNSQSFKKFDIIALSLKNTYYQIYLNQCIYDKTMIRSNETIIYIEESVKIFESKNKCTFVESGYRYEKHPNWSIEKELIGENAKCILTDKAIYLDCLFGTRRYPYSKIVNIGKTEYLENPFFDIKTSSPYPHRFNIDAMKFMESRDFEGLYNGLLCLSDFLNR